jgi:hypothetical protein
MRKALLLLSLVFAAIPGLAQTQIDLTTQVKGILPPANFANSSLTNTTVLYNNYYQGIYSATVTYSQGQMVTSSGTTYISLINSNLNNTPASSPSDWAGVASGEGGNVTSCSLTTNTLPLATGAGAICNSLVTDISGVLNYSGTNVTFPKLTIGSVGSGNYVIVGTDTLGNPGTQYFSSNPSYGVTVDATGFYGPGVNAGGVTAGDLVVSGNTNLGELGNGVPGSPIYVNQYGGGAIAMQFNGGVYVTGAIELSNGFGTSGQVPVSGGPSGVAAWGTVGGSTTYPGAGVANSTGSAWATSYTVGTVANDLVQLNGSAALPAVSGANLTAITAANISAGTAGISISGSAANLAGCTGSTAGDVCYWNGSSWARLAGNTSGTLYLQENGSGSPSWAASSTVYPGAGVANSTGSAWATSYTVGTSASNLVQLNSGAQLPAVSGANLTSLTAANISSGTAGINISGNAATATQLTGCAGSTAGDFCYWNGSAWTRLAGNTSGTQILQETSSGTPSWASGTAFTYPGAGVVCSTGSAWCTSYTVGTAANDLVELNGSAQLPAVSGALLTNLPAANLTGTASVNTTGSAGSLSAFIVPRETTVASAATITPGGAGGFIHITGTATVTTITVPSGCTSTSIVCIYQMLPDNGFSVGTGGNIDVGETIPINTPTLITWDQNNGTWYLGNFGNVTTGVSSLTSGVISVATSPYSIGNSLLSDSGSALTYSGSSGLDLTGSGAGITISGGSAPGYYTLGTGTASLPSLPAGSYGEVGSLSGGTPYLRQHANTATAGFEEWAAPATEYGVNVTQSSFVHIPFHMDSVTASVAIYPLNYYLSIAFPQTAGHFSKLQGYYDGGGCPTPPSINVANITQATVGTALALNATGLAQQSETLSWNAGDEVVIEISTAGSCSGSFHTVSADGLIP